MIDTTGSSLFKRGYRTEKGGAPIKENMAAAILQLSNWRQVFVALLHLRNGTGSAIA
ncbi:N-6 adenine-specific DNA methylase [Streptococcus pneumoniae]|nr:N-6 adenine-specific DNA methylase [Streptococcus pneumoniae]